MRGARLKNIELFDLYVGKVFAHLYVNFPLRVEIIAEKFVHIKIDDNDFNVSKEYQIFHDTIIWLKENNYIKYQDENQFYFSMVVLTAKGLELLKAVPQSLEIKDGIGEKLKRCVDMGSEEMIKNTVNTILSMGVSMFTNG